ncbi:MAG TPA: triose-phosphate isomerase [Acetobacteraceae bacterium]|jgi:triosephosphate isomerase|nr:triose-phosphate isomerase [Acetobacteraceae bacterium]
MPQLIAGNWKMNGLRAESVALARAVREGAAGLACELLVCPPGTVLAAVADVLGDSPVAVGGQDCHTEPRGARTGDIAAPMLRDAGASWVIVGHSERRLAYSESNTLVQEKAIAAIAAGLTPIICVGETEQQRLSGTAETVVAAQVDGSVPPGFAGVVAYEPVWAIGTGRSAASEDIVTMHRCIRDQLLTTLGPAGEGIRILYGGSVKPAGADALLRLPGVGGALVGGASLVADDFLAIAGAASQ